MSRSKKAGSQAGWALIMEHVALARVEVHRLHQLLNKVLDLIKKSPEKEHLYQVAGDLILWIPERVEKLEKLLDTTSYALAVMGTEHLKERLPVSDRARVEETVEGAKAFSVPRERHSKLLQRYLVSQVLKRKG